YQRKYGKPWSPAGRAASPQGAMNENRQPLDGRWLISFAVYQGHDVPAERLKEAFPSELVIAGDRFGLVWAGKRHDGTVQVNPFKTPAEIDFTGPVFDELKPRQGIFQLRDDELILCLSFAGPGADSPRPTGFETRPQSKDAVVIYHRENSAAAADD